MAIKTFRSNLPVIVIGSGLAGLLAAVSLADKTPVIVLTKKKLCDSNTQHSQGGIAAVWSSEDSSDLHIDDTLSAGRGLCDKEAVSVLSNKSKESIQRLIDLGVLFDKDDKGSYLLGLEGAHSIPRILYAGGDATGAEIQRALAKSASIHPNITILENSHVVEIINEGGQLEGVEYFDSNGNRAFIGCNQIVLATGGAGQLFQFTSNPATATGEGNILAYLAGAELSDLEFFQFHPTGLCIPGVPNFLISEAVRGERAVLRNQSGKAIMEGIHPLKDLAPRDIVARTIANELSKTPQSKVFLDATQIDPVKLTTRFPTIFNSCFKHNIDIRKDPIPVTPVAHYMIGGVTSDLNGRTNVRGLYVSGEVSRTGVHGANRLASNSLLECAVFSMQVANSIIEDRKQLPKMWGSVHDHSIPLNSVYSAHKNELSLADFQQMMWKKAGLIRNKESLVDLLDQLRNYPLVFNEDFTPEKIELHMLKNLGRLIALSALQREESRGSHYRSDFPENKKSFLYPITRTYSTDKHNF
ncbi:L-aspartate oxidase [bacterium]|nr:L-aspartate oxidase [bacterium]